MSKETLINVAVVLAVVYLMAPGRPLNQVTAMLTFNRGGAA